MRSFDSGATTHVGRRANNEDALCAVPDLGLFAVADGLGGYEGGEIASALAIQTVSELVGRRRVEAAGGHAGRSSADFWHRALGEAFAVAQEEIRKRQVGPLAMMGSTLSALVLAGDAGSICHVGDSRIYVLRRRELQQLTRDHTLLGEIAERGVEVPAERRRAYRNELTGALGMEGGSEPDHSTSSVEPADVFLLCTDGLYGALPVDEIILALERDRAQEASEALVERAYRAGAEDNLTAVVVRVSSDGS